MPYNPNRGRGLGLSSEQHPYPQKSWRQPEYAPYDNYGAHDEFANSMSKHGAHGDSPPFSYRRELQRSQQFGDDTEKMNRAEKFFNDFERDVLADPGLKQGELEPYTDMNADVVNRKMAEWRRRAHQYGLSEEEADNVMNDWLAYSD